MPEATRNMTRLAVVSERTRKMDRRTSGAAERSSITMKEASSAAARMKKPTVTLTKKIHGQENDSVRKPPSTSPTAEPPMAMAAQTPSARERSLPSAKV